VGEDAAVGVKVEVLYASSHIGGLSGTTVILESSFHMLLKRERFDVMLPALR
jgi:hypothetical protein